MARTPNPKPSDAQITGGNGASSVDPRAAVLSRNNAWATSDRGFLHFDNWDQYGNGYVSDDDKALMLQDPQVYAALNIRRAGVIYDGVQILPTYLRGHSDYEKSAEIADAFRWALGEVENGLHSNLHQILQHDWWKHTAAEIILQERTYQGKQYACFDLDPHGPWDYFVWKKGNSLLGLQPVNGVGNDIYPAEKFLWMPFRPDSRHWTGTDLAGVVWIDFYMKNVSRPENLKYMTIFSNPSWVGVAPEGATQEVALLSGQHDAFGRPIPLKDSNGQPIMVSPQEGMANGLKNFQGGGSGTIIPASAKLTLMQAQGDGRIFNGFDDQRDWQILTAILGTGNMTSRAKYGSNASAQTGESTVEKPVSIDAINLAATIRQKLGRAFVKWNYGPQHLDKVPRVIIGSNSFLEGVFKSVIANSPYGEDEQFLEELARRTGAPEIDFKAFSARLKEGMVAGPMPGTVTGSGQQQ